MVLGQDAKVSAQILSDSISISSGFTPLIADFPLQMLDWKKEKGKDNDYKTFLDVLALKVTSC